MDISMIFYFHFIIPYKHARGERYFITIEEDFE